MKGGITSGVVYPSAVLKLQEGGYTFRNIGGASVGAIAAVVSAAAAYGDKAQAGPGGGYDTLKRITQELGTEGFVLTLFQPAESMRPVFDVLIAALKASASPSAANQKKAGASRRMRPVIMAVAKRLTTWALVAAVVGALLWLLLGWVASRIDLVAAPDHWSGGAVALVAATTIVVLLVATLVGLILGFVITYLRVYKNFGAETLFGMCPGLQQPGYEGPGLVDWLHQRVQECAGLPVDPDDPKPLTYKHLEEQGLRLETVTTNLNYSRPYRIPFEDEGRFLFRSEELNRVFPADVVRWMESHPPSGVPDPEDGYWWMPAAPDLPVIVGARMSMSFPGLISAVPLHAHDEANPRAPVVPNWFSDGGISSNFPIHFFDGWLPSRPTFGLNLGPYPTDPRGRSVEKLQGEATSGRDDWATGDVFMPASRTDGQFPRWTHFSGFGGFVGQIVDAMENWRDNMQSELPGFRDRICEIRLADDQGGMHLAMPPDRIADLVRKGELAGDRLLNDFDWAQHRWTRYLMLMETLQVRLEGNDTHPPQDAVHERFDKLYSRLLTQGPPGVRDFVDMHDATWCSRANSATEALLAASASWNRGNAAIRFDLTAERVPAWVMRIAPKV